MGKQGACTLLYDPSCKQIVHKYDGVDDNDEGELNFFVEYQKELKVDFLCQKRTGDTKLIKLEDR